MKIKDWTMPFGLIGANTSMLDVRKAAPILAGRLRAGQLLAWLRLMPARGGDDGERFQRQERSRFRRLEGGHAAERAYYPDREYFA